MTVGLEAAWNFVYLCLLTMNDFTLVTPPDEYPATGTGTLVIQLEDVNDNAPTIDERAVMVRLLFLLTPLIDIDRNSLVHVCCTARDFLWAFRRCATRKRLLGFCQ